MSYVSNTSSLIRGCLRYIFCDAIIITQLDDASCRDAYQVIIILHEQLKSYMIITNAIRYILPTEVPGAIISKAIN